MKVQWLAQDHSLNTAPVDSWTPIHLLAGAIFGLLGAPLWAAAGAAVVYEIAEYSLEYPRGSPIFGSKRPESLVNVGVDLGVFLGGWWAGRKVR